VLTKDTAESYTNELVILDLENRAKTTSCARSPKILRGKNVSAEATALKMEELYSFASWSRFRLRN
jgi:hypothetical protein